MFDDFSTDEPDEPEDEYAPGPERYVAHVPVMMYVGIINEMELDGPPANMDEDMLGIAAARAHDIVAEIEPNTEELERRIMEWLDEEVDEVTIDLRPQIDQIELQKVE